MVGAIDKRDILTHPLVTIRCFGVRVFLRALFASRHKTFLSLLTDTEVLKPAADGVAEFVARCVELELKASRIYAAFARRYSEQPAVHEFYASLAGQEEGHAELLELCRTAAAQERWDESQAAPWRQILPRLEKKMADAEGSVDDIDSVRQSLERVIEIESSEINDVFGGVLAASDSCFVRTLRAFHDVEARHLSYICEKIAELDPNLVEASQVLRKRCA